jgi:hypothetical protein
MRWRDGGYLNLRGGAAGRRRFRCFTGATIGFGFSPTAEAMGHPATIGFGFSPTAEAMGHPATIGFGFSSTAEAMGHPGFSSTAEAMGHPGFSPTAEAMGHPLQVMRSRGPFPGLPRLVGYYQSPCSCLGYWAWGAARRNAWMLLRLPVNGSPNRSPMPIRRGSRCSARTLKPGWWTTGICRASCAARRVSGRAGPFRSRIPPRISSPQPDAALAYYVNAHNACVLVAVIRAGVPVTMYDLTLPSLETGYRFEVDGAPCTLGELRDLARAQARDARVEFAFARRPAERRNWPASRIGHSTCAPACSGWPRGR